MNPMIYHLKDLDFVISILNQEIKDKKIVSFTGSLGAGKTTIIGKMLAFLGVSEPIISPTFTYFNEYRLASGKVIYHFDLYRIKDLEEFERFGFFEYLYQDNSLVIIEWPEIIMSALNHSSCHVTIKFAAEESKRELEFVSV